MKFTKEEIEIIEKMKDKNYVKAFGLMTEGEQAIYNKVGKANCMLYYSESWILPSYYFEFNKSYTYVISSDFKPEPEEPEYEYKEVIIRNDFLCVCICGACYNTLSNIVDMSDFRGFWAKDSDGRYMEVNRISYIARMLKTKQVYAKFEVKK